MRLRAMDLYISGFARMPQLNLSSGELNVLVEEVAEHFRAAFPAIAFPLQLEPGLPAIALDREALPTLDQTRKMGRLVFASVPARLTGAATCPAPSVCRRVVQLDYRRD